MIKYLIDFSILFISIYLIYVFLINRKRKTYERLKKNSEVTLVIKRYKLDMKKIKYKRLLNNIALINSFILSFTTVIILNIKSVFFRIIIGFIVAFILTYCMYEILGRIYKNKGLVEENK